MRVGGRYNWKGQPERLIYLGFNWSGNGYWHQFEKVGEPGKVWCEVLDSDLHCIEETRVPSPMPCKPGFRASPAKQLQERARLARLRRL